MMSSGPQAVTQVLTANQPPDRFYSGGARIAAFRGDPPPDGNVPEDWVASTTTLFGAASLGLSRLPDGTLLVDAVTADPQAWLGPDHVTAFGTDVALLVKLLDAGQRLPVHAHPDGAFAGEHLALNHGKTEAWIFLEPATVYLAFTRDVGADELAGWVAGQDVGAMLATMHSLPVAAGDAVLVPAGLPHAIGAGAFLVELQEPTDLSVLLEWKGFAIDGAELGHLGLGFDLALRSVDRRAWSADELAVLRSARAADTGPLLPGASAFFRADRVIGAAAFDPGFAVVVVTAGRGVLRTSSGLTPVHQGQSVVVPYAAGIVELAGDDLDALVCRPPAVR
jgi:mannose-6-phosphate isomerase